MPAAAVPAAPAGGPVLVDAVVGVVEGRLVTASDIGLARALGAFGLAPSAGPITADDVEHLIRARLVVAEADRLGVAPTVEETDAAWHAIAERLGGHSALEAWLGRAAVDAAWARTLAAEDLAWRRYVDLRFRDFVFVTEDEVTAALGPGPHPEATRERWRVALRERETARRLTEWLTEATARAAIQRLLDAGQTLPCPVPMP